MNDASIPPADHAPASIAPAEIQVPLSSRLAEFDRDGTLAADAREIAQIIAGREDVLARAFWAHYNGSPHLATKLTGAAYDEAMGVSVPYLRLKFTDAAGQGWADLARDHAWAAHSAGLPLSTTLAAMAVAHRATIAMIHDQPDLGFARMMELDDAVTRLAVIEADIMAACVAELRGRQAHVDRAHHADLFQSRIAAEVSEAVSLGDQLRTQATGASEATRGMLGKASEVAAAAEQSAVAMRDAAHTAAGLIRAIEEARGEVENAAEVANRAALQASEAVAVSGTLSDTAESIESILGLIRDVAGQTNLLALNATIEAARAGDAGRGFAVVAQEVKSLASQTARATDEIAGKIAAIQAATRSTVASNGSIRDIVAEVQASAMRIREAMEVQAQTVTMITAAVDETALAADTMSSTIAAIRTDTENVAAEIDALEGGFAGVNGKLAGLQDATGDYVRLVA